MIVQNTIKIAAYEHIQQDIFTLLSYVHFLTFMF